MNQQYVASLSRVLLAVVVLGLFGGGVAAQTTCPTNPGRFAVNGAEVVDRYTGLTWMRCSLGQVPSGNHQCAGAATLHTHQQALLAGTQAGWRLPNVKELDSLVDLGCYGTTIAAIDYVAFPSTPRSYFWSTTPYGGGVTSMIVDFQEGEVSTRHRSSTSYVRLVRSTT